MTIFWTLVLVTMLNYVVSSVQNVDFEFMNGVIISIPTAIILIIMTTIIPNEPVASKQH